MSSLVAYEDSDSEDENLGQTFDRGATLLQTRSSTPKQNQEGGMSSHVGFTTNFDETILSPPDQSSEQTSHLERISLLHGIMEKNAAPQALAHIQPSIHTLKASKRHNSLHPTVRPYIPKRQRLATLVESLEPVYRTEHIQESPREERPGEKRSGEERSEEERIGEESTSLSDVSATVKPYLSQTLSEAGVPRRLLISLQGHQGPVNTVQWCPVPQLSHLLLSASMDKTFKVWDGAGSGRCLGVYTCHSGAVRDTCWTPCGRRILTGSFDNTAVITDVETAQTIVKFDNQFKAMCVALHPNQPEVFLCGGYSSAVKAWDSRSGKVVKVYKAAIQQTLDILFLRGGTDFITSSDCVSRDSADRTLIAWDYHTTAKVSNQIYQERYTCPSLALHPLEESFVAQTNGNYMALFSSQRPYRMNKRRRFEGHKVEGYAVQCEFSLDGTLLASGSSTGSAHFFDSRNARMLHTLSAHSQPCVCVSQHPVLPATAATCDWAGEVKVWH